MSSATRTKPPSSRRSGQEPGRPWVWLTMAVLATIGLIDPGSITAKRWGWIGSLSCPVGSDGCDKVLGSAWGHVAGPAAVSLWIPGLRHGAPAGLDAVAARRSAGPCIGGQSVGAVLTSSGMAVFSLVLMGLLV
jgi:hypothetical protein